MNAASGLKLVASILVLALSYGIYKYTQGSNSREDTDMRALRTFSLDAKIFNPTLYSNVTKLWFDGLPPGAIAPPEQLQKRWFGYGLGETAKASFDHQCRSGFDEALSSISPTRLSLPAFTDVETDRGNYADIAAPFLGQFYQNGSGKPEAALGLTILLDQIPRNIYRKDQALIYGHYDRIARAVFYAIHKHQLDRHERYFLSPAHRLWFYMPLEHSESLVDHQLFGENVEDLQSRLEAKGDEASQYIGEALNFARRHSVILERFGRYPHRNRSLERATTDEEQKWLDDGGDTFGA